MSESERKEELDFKVSKGGGMNFDNTLREFSIPRTWTAQNERRIIEPYLHLSTQPGKNIRGKLIEAFNVWLKVPEEKLCIITDVIGLLHTASLMVDDVEDSATLRRGVPVAHSIFGIPQTINSANYIYFCALKELSSLNNPALLQIYTDELINLHRGQGMDLYWRDSLTCPTEVEYLDMVNYKTGGLFRLAIKLMQQESRLNTDADFIPLVCLIGIMFQIRDDYMNLSSDFYCTNKGFCEDLTEGKFSFPIIHAIRWDPQNTQLMNILKQKSADDDIKAFALSYMRDTTRSLEYTMETLENLDSQARQEIRRLGGNTALMEILNSWHSSLCGTD